MRTVEHWIDGVATAGDSTRTSPIWNPATGEQQARGGAGQPSDVDRDVAAAAAAFESWRETSLERADPGALRLPRAGERHVGELAEVITDEHGKVLSDAAGEVQRGLEVVEFACGIPQLLKGDYSDQVSTGVDSFSFREPLGVVAGITPFNFPVMVPMWMFPVAIACGNTFVLKPSERDPSASMLVARALGRGRAARRRLQRRARRQGGRRRAARPPATSRPSRSSGRPRSPATSTGAATANGKRVQALGGAKNHAIVLPDADIDFAAEHLAAAAFGSAGERCMAISAAVAVGAAGDALVERVDDRARAVRVGSGRDPRARWDRSSPPRRATASSGSSTRARRQGADIAVDGRELVVAGLEDGFFVGPTVIDEVTPEMDVYTEEIFGPVLSVLRADDRRRGHRAGQREPLRQRHGDLHHSGEAARTVPARRQGRHDRHQRAGAGADGLLLLRRLEGLAVRRPPHPRTRGRGVLHPGQGGDEPLARGRRPERGIARHAYRTLRMLEP